MTAKAREEERHRLIAQIQEWNLNRLDLFALSQPNEDLEFFGVMRYFYQDEGEKVSTKCIRVSSTATTKDVMDILIEKFRPDMRMLTRPNYALYELHINGEERKLRDSERPLLVQLNWGKDDREGRFLLKKETDKTVLTNVMATTGNQPVAEEPPTFKRKLSKREKKEMKKKEKEEKIKGKENDHGMAEKLYNELPDSSFTRSISNPELVMRKRRQLKLEKKLQQIKSNDGGPDSGGTLKIYGHAVNPDVPYKTLLLSVTDNVSHVVKETLEKYSMEKEDPDYFCLVQVMIPPDGPDYGKDPKERILDDEECPLAILLQHPSSKDYLETGTMLETDWTIMFQLRPRPSDMPKKRPRPTSMQRDSRLIMPEGRGLPMATLVQINPDGNEVSNGRRFILPGNSTEIGSERSMHPNAQSIQLATPDVLPQHCIINRMNNTASIMPLSKDAVVLINGVRITETVQLRHGVVIQIGKMHVFRYLDPGVDEQRKRISAMPQQNAAPRGVSVSGTARDFETTFDVDGHVETVPTADRNLPLVAAPDPRFGPPGYEADLLPATLNFREEVEDKLLNNTIAEVNGAAIQFKMAPAYVLYMATRSRVSCLSRPDLSSGERARRVGNITNKMAHLINQIVRENKANPAFLSFWMANASELLHFLKTDCDIFPSCLQAQNVLAEAVQMAFSFLVDCLQKELEQTMMAFLSPGPDEGDMEVIEDFAYKRVPPTIGNVVHVLSLAMSVLRKCRVNAALTIQLFSCLFHFINSWLFNYVVLKPGMQLCSRDWGRRLRRRLNHIMVWAEKQGLELAAECHLTKILQAAYLLESPKAVQDLNNIVTFCENLNSIQLHAIMNNYILSPGEPPLRNDVVDRIIVSAQNGFDETLRNEGQDLRVDEPMDLQLPFLLPDDGYSCDFVKGVPNGLTEFLDPLIQIGVCQMTVNPNSQGSWTVYMTSKEDTHTYQNLKSDASGRPPEVPLSRKEPEMIIVSFGKVKNSLGLSIVAAKGENQREKAIYIKSVVPGGGAASDGRLAAGDQLVEVDGRSLIGVTQEKAAEMMGQTGQVVNLKVAKQAAAYHGLSSLLNQPSPVVNRVSPIKPILAPAAGDIMMRAKVDDSSRFEPQPFNNKNQRPLVQQHEARSTPTLSGPKVQEPKNRDSGQFYKPPQLAGEIRSVAASKFDSNKPTSTSQPDLMIQQKEPGSQFDDRMRQPQMAAHDDPYRSHQMFPGNSLGDGSKLKETKSTPNISMQPNRPLVSEVPDHQKVLEWQQWNNRLQEQDRQPMGGFDSRLANPPPAPSYYTQPQDPQKYALQNPDVYTSQSQIAGNMKPEIQRVSPREQLDFKQPMKSGALPGQPIGQPISTQKPPGYATQMLFPNAVPQSKAPQNQKSFSPPKIQQQDRIPPSSGYVQAPSQGFPSQALNISGQPQDYSSNYQQGYLPRQNLPAPISQGYAPVHSPSGFEKSNNSAAYSPSDHDFPPPPPDVQLAQLRTYPPAVSQPQKSPPLPPTSFAYETPGSVSQPPYAGSQPQPMYTGSQPKPFLPNQPTSKPYNIYENKDDGSYGIGAMKLQDSSATVYGGQGQKQPQTLYGSNYGGYPGGPADVGRVSLPLNDNASRYQGQSTVSRIETKPAPAPVKKAPPVATKPKLNAEDLKLPSTSPWDKEAREKQNDEELRRKRSDEIRRLENRPYLSQEEQNKLNRLRTEAEFDRRVQERSETDFDDDTIESPLPNRNISLTRPTEERKQDIRSTPMDDRRQDSRPTQMDDRRPDNRLMQPQMDDRRPDNRPTQIQEVTYAKIDRNRPLDDVPPARPELPRANVQPVESNDYYHSSRNDFASNQTEYNQSLRSTYEQQPQQNFPGYYQPYPEMQRQPPGTSVYQGQDEPYRPPQTNVPSMDSQRPYGGPGYQPNDLQKSQPWMAKQEQDRGARNPQMKPYDDRVAEFQQQPSYVGGYPPFGQDKGGEQARKYSPTANELSEIARAGNQSEPAPPMHRAASASVLKQPDSQMPGVKKSVTFSENVGINEYAINRSYGSTSSEGSSFPLSPEQSYFGGRPEADPSGPQLSAYGSYNKPESIPSLQQQQNYPSRAPDSGATRYSDNREPMGTSFPYRGMEQDMPQQPGRGPPQMFPYQGSADPYQAGVHYQGGPTGYQYPNRPSGPVYPQDVQYSQADPRLSMPQYQDRTPEAVYDQRSNVTLVPGSTPGVVGTQEVYFDPRDRIAASKGAGPPRGGPRITPDRMSFRDKMGMFAAEAGEMKTS